VRMRFLGTTRGCRAPEPMMPSPGCSAMLTPLQISEHQPGDAAKSSCVPAAIIRCAHLQPSPFCQGRSALPPRGVRSGNGAAGFRDTSWHAATLTRKLI
jgi:hypothetical protein